jgi:transcriptional repressor OPI1
VVDVVSKYAGASLPGEAKKSVRGLIMCLPQKWANASGTTGERRGSVSGSSAVAAGSGGAVGRGTKGRREHKRERGSGGGSGNWNDGELASTGKTDEGGTHNQVAAMQGSFCSSFAFILGSYSRIAAQKILTLATESLDMMRGVTGIVKDSLDRAETWVGRLRVVGLQQSASEDAQELDNPTFEPQGKEESGYETPSSSSNSIRSISHSHSTSTSEWSLPSTPGEPVDAASPEAGIVVDGIGELSLGGLAVKAEGDEERIRDILGVEEMEVDG